MFKYLPIVLISIVFAVITTKLIEFVVAVFIAPFRRKKYLAENKYKTVKAEKISKYESPDQKGYYHLVYKYEVDGKVYRKGIYTSLATNPYITLYYIKNPRYAVGNKNELCCVENKKTIFFILTIVFFVLLASIWNFT